MLKYAYNDFAIRQVAFLVGDAETERTYPERSLVRTPPLSQPHLLIDRVVYGIQMWRATASNVDWFDQHLTESHQSCRFHEKACNEWFLHIWRPSQLLPKDNSDHTCSLQQENRNGFYEGSSWEYSFFVPHDTAWLIEAMGGNKTFGDRLDHFFGDGYYLAGNEPSFQVLNAWVSMIQEVADSG